MEPKKSRHKPPKSSTRLQTRRTTYDVEERIDTSSKFDLHQDQTYRDLNSSNLYSNPSMPLSPSSSSSSDSIHSPTFPGLQRKLIVIIPCIVIGSTNTNISLTKIDVPDWIAENEGNTQQKLQLPKGDIKPWSKYLGKLYLIDCVGAEGRTLNYGDVVSIQVGSGRMHVNGHMAESVKVSQDTKSAFEILPPFMWGYGHEGEYGERDTSVGRCLIESRRSVENAKGFEGKEVGWNQPFQLFHRQTRRFLWRRKAELKRLDQIFDGSYTDAEWYYLGLWNYPGSETFFKFDTDQNFTGNYERVTENDELLLCAASELNTLYLYTKDDQVLMCPSYKTSLKLTQLDTTHEIAPPSNVTHTKTMNSNDSPSLNPNNHHQVLPEYELNFLLTVPSHLSEITLILSSSNSLLTPLTHLSPSIYKLCLMFHKYLRNELPNWVSKHSAVGEVVHSRVLRGVEAVKQITKLFESVHQTFNEQVDGHTLLRATLGEGSESWMQTAFRVLEVMVTGSDQAVDVCMQAVTVLKAFTFVPGATRFLEQLFTKVVPRVGNGFIDGSLRWDWISEMLQCVEYFVDKIWEDPQLAFYDVMIELWVVDDRPISSVQWTIFDVLCNEHDFRYYTISTDSDCQQIMIKYNTEDPNAIRITLQSFLSSCDSDSYTRLIKQMLLEESLWTGMSLSIKEFFQRQYTFQALTNSIMNNLLPRDIRALLTKLLTKLYLTFDSTVDEADNSINLSSISLHWQIQEDLDPLQSYLLQHMMERQGVEVDAFEISTARLILCLLKKGSFKDSYGTVFQYALSSLEELWTHSENEGITRWSSDMAHREYLKDHTGDYDRQNTTEEIINNFKHFYLNSIDCHKYESSESTGRKDDLKAQLEAKSKQSNAECNSNNHFELANATIDIISWLFSVFQKTKARTILKEALENFKEMNNVELLNSSKHEHVFDVLSREDLLKQLEYFIWESIKSSPSNSNYFINNSDEKEEIFDLWYQFHASRYGMINRLYSVLSNLSTHSNYNLTWKVTRLLSRLVVIESDVLSVLQTSWVILWEHQNSFYQWARKTIDWLKNEILLFQETTWESNSKLEATLQNHNLNPSESLKTHQNQLLHSLKSHCVLQNQALTFPSLDTHCLNPSSQLIYSHLQLHIPLLSLLAYLSSIPDPPTDILSLCTHTLYLLCLSHPSICTSLLPYVHLLAMPALGKTPQVGELTLVQMITDKGGGDCDVGGLMEALKERIWHQNLHVVLRISTNLLRGSKNTKIVTKQVMQLLQEGGVRDDQTKQGFELNMAVMAYTERLLTLGELGVLREMLSKEFGWMDLWEMVEQIDKWAEGFKEKWFKDLINFYFQVYFGSEGWEWDQEIHKDFEDFLRDCIRKLESIDVNRDVSGDLLNDSTTQSLLCYLPPLFDKIKRDNFWKLQPNSNLFYWLTFINKILAEIESIKTTLYETNSEINLTIQIIETSVADKISQLVFLPTTQDSDIWCQYDSSESPLLIDNNCISKVLTEAITKVSTDESVNKIIKAKNQNNIDILFKILTSQMPHSHLNQFWCGIIESMKDCNKDNLLLKMLIGIVEMCILNKSSDSENIQMNLCVESIFTSINTLSLLMTLFERASTESRQIDILKLINHAIEFDKETTQLKINAILSSSKSSVTFTQKITQILEKFATQLEMKVRLEGNTGFLNPSNFQVLFQTLKFLRSVHLNDSTELHNELALENNVKQIATVIMRLAWTTLPLLQDVTCTEILQQSLHTLCELIEGFTNIIQAMSIMEGLSDLVNFILLLEYRIDDDLDEYELIVPQKSLKNLFALNYSKKRLFCASRPVSDLSLSTLKYRALSVLMRLISLSEDKEGNVSEILWRVGNNALRMTFAYQYQVFSRIHDKKYRNQLFYKYSKDDRNDDYSPLIIENGFLLYFVLARAKIALKDSRLLPENLSNLLSLVPPKRKIYTTVNKNLFYELADLFYDLHSGWRLCCRSRRRAMSNDKMQEWASKDIKIQKALQFHSDNYSQVDILYNNELISYSFPKLPFCKFRSQAQKTKFLNKLLISQSPKMKCENLVRICDDLVIETQTDYWLRHSIPRVLSVFPKYGDLWKDLLSPVIIFLNIILLVSYSKANSQDVDDPKFWFLSIEDTRILLHVVGGYCLYLVIVVFFNTLATEIPLKINQYDRIRVNSCMFTSSQSDSTLQRKISKVTSVSWSIVTEKILIFYFILIVLAALGTIRWPFYYWYLLTYIVHRSATLMNVLRAIWEPKFAIMMTILMMLMVLYSFSVLAFFWLSDDYPDNTCYSLWGWFVASFDQTFKNDGGIGGYLESAYNPLTNGDVDINYRRIIFDNISFLLVALLLLEIISGIIIDKFGELRQRHKEIQDDLRSSCFICGRDRDDLETESKLGFIHHTNHVHNIWDYWFFIAYLKHKDSIRGSEFTQLEYYVLRKLKEGDNSWFPWYQE